MLDAIEDLLAKIRLGEDSILELKAITWKGEKVAGPSRDDLADELAAMANTADGVVVLGVDDRTHEILGIPLERLDAVEALVREVCNDSIRPPLSVKIVRMELPDELGSQRAVLKVDVPRSLFVHESPGGYFRRLGSSRRKMFPEQLARLFQQRSQTRVIRFDEQPVPETLPSDLDEPLCRRLLGSVGEAPERTFRKMKILTQDDVGVERVSVAGVLLCTAHPERWLPCAEIQAVRYRGVEADANYQEDAHRIQGPLDRQIHDAWHFVQRTMWVAATKSPARREIPEFDPRAVFEAIVNAVAHRDYSLHGARIRLFVFDDRLELYSPGALPNSMTVESLELRQSTRNELITSLLARCDTGDREETGRSFFLEKRGEGVPIIFRQSERNGARKPEYRLLDDEELRLTIWAPPKPTPVG